MKYMALGRHYFLVKYQGLLESLRLVINKTGLGSGCYISPKQSPF